MKTITRYINMKSSFGTETVDEFAANTKEERKELRRCLDEYRLADRSASYYISQRCTKDWKNK